MIRHVASSVHASSPESHMLLIYRSYLDSRSLLDFTISAWDRARDVLRANDVSAGVAK